MTNPTIGYRFSDCLEDSRIALFLGWIYVFQETEQRRASSNLVDGGGRTLRVFLCLKWLNDMIQVIQSDLYVPVGGHLAP